MFPQDYIPARDRVHPEDFAEWMQRDNDNESDDLAAFRGLTVSVCLGLCFWIVLGAVAWAVWHG